MSFTVSKNGRLALLNVATQVREQRAVVSVSKPEYEDVFFNLGVCVHKDDLCGFTFHIMSQSSW